MQGHPDRAFRHVQGLPGLGRACPLDPDHPDKPPRAVIQKPDHLGHVGGLGRIGSGLGGKDLVEILDRHFHLAAARPEGVDDLVARDGVKPRPDRRTDLPGVPLEVDRKQHLLQHVLADRLAKAPRLCPDDAPQDRSDRPQKGGIGPTVARVRYRQQSAPVVHQLCIPCLPVRD